MKTDITPLESRVSFVAMVAVVVTTLLVPSIALAQTSKDKARQNDKNLMRNLAVGAGAAAVYEGVKGHRTSALILGAGAIYAGKKYEDARKAQNHNKRHYAYSGIHHPANNAVHSSERHHAHRHFHEDYRDRDDHNRDHHDEGLHRGWDKHREKHGNND